MFRTIIVDDIPIIRQSISKHIEESNLPLIAAATMENGVQALEWLSNYHADICITDIKMPVMDGLELIENIKKSFPWIASIIISSYHEFSYAQKSIHLEVFDYILKPIDRKNLSEVLTKSIEKIQKARLTQANSILFSNRAKCTALLDKWTEYIKLSKEDHKDLIEETCILLTKLIEENYFLLVPLALSWLNMVSSDLQLNLSDISKEVCNQADNSHKLVAKSEAEKYFSSECISILSAGINIIHARVNEQKGFRYSRLVEQIIQYVADNYAHPNLTIQEIADHVLVSKSYMSNIFKQEVGMTLWNYIIDYRMKKAREYLSESSAKIYEIANSVGYSDYIHFSRLFKEIHGISPQDYRKKTNK